MTTKPPSVRPPTVDTSGSILPTAWLNGPVTVAFSDQRSQLDFDSLLGVNTSGLLVERHGVVLFLTWHSVISVVPVGG